VVCTCVLLRWIAGSVVLVIIRLRRMHQMQTIVIDDRGVCLSVCLSVTNASNDPAPLGRLETELTVEPWLTTVKPW